MKRIITEKSKIRKMTVRNQLTVRCPRKTDCSKVGLLSRRHKALAAFTLAEVLITLAIIGVVAALTIPTLMQKNQEKETVAALKKAYSTLQSAYTLAVQENGTPDNWGGI